MGENTVVVHHAEIVPMCDIEAMGRAIAKSGLFGMRTPEQAIALLLVAQSEGRHPASAARDYDIIQGKPAKRAEAMLRDFLAGGGKVEWHTLDDTIADATFSHPSGGSARIAWDMKRVEKAQISNAAMYAKYPRQMLRSRTVSEGVRTVYPMATSGMYVPEEVQGFGARLNHPENPDSDGRIPPNLEHAAEAEVSAIAGPATGKTPPLPTKPPETPQESTPALQGDMAGQPQDDDQEHFYSGIVERVEVKDGVNAKTGKRYRRYGVTISHGSESAVYGTFDDKIGEVAIMLKDKACTYEWELNGKYKNLMAIKSAEN